MFYPSTLRSESMLGYYAERLSAVELNGSFYRTPPATAMAKWVESAAPGFRFCLKANRGVTYSSDRFDRAGLAADFSRRLEPLGQSCGPILLQFPPVRQADASLLETILAALGRPAAVEFRHESWLHDEMYEVLRRHAAALVVTDQEKWPLAPRLNLARFAYFRLRRDYDEAGLQGWAGQVQAELAEREAVYVFFKHEPEAPARAMRLRALVDDN